MTETPPPPLHLRRTGLEPADELTSLRDTEPVREVFLPVSGMRGWLVTRHADVRAVLGDPAHFSSTPPTPPEEGPLSARRVQPGFLLGYDPPEHATLRRMLTAEFTVARMRRLQPRIEAIVEEHLDRMAATNPPVDLVESFALSVPLLVICELLGVPFADRAEFGEQSKARLNLALPIEERMAAIDQARAYMARLVKSLREQPDDNMLGMLIQRHGDELSDEELVGIGDLLLLAGHETTSNMLATGTLALLENPGQLAAVRDDPEAVGPAVEEMLRYLSVVPTGMPRKVTEDIELGGKQLRAGDMVLTSLPAANRDEVLGTDLNSLDLGRNTTTHVAFGHGIHHCLGAPLARMEMRTAFPALLRRFPGLRLAVPYEELTFRIYSVVFGVDALPVTW